MKKIPFSIGRKCYRLKMVAPYLIYRVNESKTNAIVLRANHRPMQMYN